MTGQKSLKKNAVFNFIKSFANLIFPIISFPYASRVLLPDGIGAVNFANSIIEYFILIAELGISTYATREAARIRDNRAALTKFTREILFFNLITTITAYLLMLLSLFIVPHFSVYRVLLIICSTKILFTTLGTNWMFTALEEYGYITIRHMIFQAISLVLLFSLVKTKEDYLTYAAIGVFSNVGANIFNFFYARKFVDIFEKSTIELKRHVKPIMTFFGMTCAGKINNLIDTTMLGFLCGNTSVGLYSASTKLNQMVRELITSVISTFMPRTSYLLEKKESDEYKTLITKVFGVAVFFSIPAALGLIVLAKPLTVIFCGDKYVDAIPTMQLLSLCIIVTCANSFLNNLILTPNRLERFMLYAQLIALFANMTINYFFIIKWGVFGAGIATLIVETILPLVKLIPSWKYIRNKTNLMELFKSMIGSAVMFVTIHFSIAYIPSNCLKIIIGLCEGTMIYYLAEIIMKHATARMILGMLMKKIKRG